MKNILESIKILYVENYSISANSLAKFLLRRSEYVSIAHNGKEGLDLFMTGQPDIIITDIAMPIMNGFEMIEKIREISKDIPIIIITDHKSVAYYQKAINLGVDRYITKPFSLKELVNILNISAKAILQQRVLSDQSNLIKGILDISSSFIIITNKKEISYMNKAFLIFTGCSSLKDFNIKYADMKGLIVLSDNKDCSNLTFKEWISIVITPTIFDSKVVDIKLPDNDEVFSYLIHVNSFPDSINKLVSFSNVTMIENDKKYYQEIASYDELTRIYNRKKFNEELETQINHSVRYKTNLSLTIFDLDFFKKTNDSFGHIFGDYILKEIAVIVNNSIRKTDVFARFGGEEFVIIMPHTTLKQAIDTAERIRVAIEIYKFKKNYSITCSFGVAEFDQVEDCNNFLNRADTALYKAKNSGRNRVEAS